MPAAASHVTGTHRGPDDCRIEKRLQEAADRIRRLTLSMIQVSGMGHPGSSLSTIETLTVLYHHVMNISPVNVTDDPRDRFVLSKGHAAPALYATLIDTGILPRSLISSLRHIDSPLQGHPDPRFTQGVEFPTGSLGQGFSAAVGMALGLRRLGSPSHVYALIGDGECQEGQIWEAANLAAAQKLNNLTVVVDDNGLQHDAPTPAMLGQPDLAPRWSAFGWETNSLDGHDIGALVSALEIAGVRGPKVVIAKTIKGKGVPFMENRLEWHSIADSEMLSKAIISDSSSEAAT